MRDVINLFRIHQWIKNVFIFLPLFFNKNFGDWERLSGCLFAFLGFSLITSAVYSLNDIMDREHDRQHPKKRERPLASGKIPVSVAFLLFAGLIVGGFLVLFLTGLPLPAMGVTGIYLILMVAYCFILKKIPVVDVFVIGIGFVLRIVLGGIAGEVVLSHWIIIMTFLLAIFLGFAKRLDDVRMYTDTGVIGRKNIVRYNALFLTSLIIITSTVTLVAYLMYTLSPEVIIRFNSQYIYVTALFVAMGLFRYLQLVMVDKRGGNPTAVLLKDRGLQLCIGLWVASFYLLIYVL